MMAGKSAILADLGVSAVNISLDTLDRAKYARITGHDRFAEVRQAVDEALASGMGCVVNGPGEAREADIGIAGGRDCGILFRKGEVLGKVRGAANLLPAFMDELERFLAEKKESPCD